MKERNSGNSKRNNSNLRGIAPKRIATLRRQMDGAQKRMYRFDAESKELAAHIRRKYIDRFDDTGKFIERNPLTPAQIDGLRLSRVKVNKELTIAKGDYQRFKSEYQKAVQHNIQVERKSVDLIRTENRIRRESRKLLNKTMDSIKEHGQNGGAKQVERLKSLALEGNVKEFRIAFDEAMQSFDHAHHTTISGVSEVKTEIIHIIMDMMVEDANQNQNEAISPQEDKK